MPHEARNTRHFSSEDEQRFPGSSSSTDTRNQQRKTPTSEPGPSTNPEVPNDVRSNADPGHSFNYDVDTEMDEANVAQLCQEGGV